MTNRANRGFTLLEVLVAISILVIITGIVYASLASVVRATEIARVSADEMRMRQFLEKSFHANFTTIVADSVFEDERYVLIGISEKSSNGAMDSIEFACSAPVLGGGSPPGAFKRVYYGAVSKSPGAGGGGFFGSDDAAAVGKMTLEASEQMMLDPEFAAEYAPESDLFGDGTSGSADLLQKPQKNTMNSSEFGSTMGGSGFSGSGDSERKRSTAKRKKQSSREATLPDTAAEEAPGWRVNVDQFDVAFFDGYEWVEDWDSIEFGGMPWAIRIRMNYARNEEERDADSSAGIDRTKDFDYETVIPIPIGAGLLSEEEREANPLGNQRPNRGNSGGRSDSGSDDNDGEDDSSGGSGGSNDSSGNSNSGGFGSSSGRFGSSQRGRGGMFGN